MKGLLFSEPMVKAWMAGNKTITRRIMNPQPEWEEYPGFCQDGIWRGRYRDLTYDGCDYVVEVWEAKPRYTAGETVYIKEGWRIGAWKEDGQCVAVDYRADGFARKEWLLVPDEEMFERLWIQSTDDAIKAGLKMDCDGQYHWEPGQSPCRWRAPRFMPEWAARRHALIVSVIPERLQEINEIDAYLEGFRDQLRGDTFYSVGAQFKETWDKLHPGTWDKNPWVWRIELEKI